ncbi:MAG: DUF6090 family protein [Bacteroidia bacterium]|nr:DUF6090 family protein [Bacteroidia bacterium]
MRRFFRQIRQKHISSSKLLNYLLYAVGEILLVVIGILIALQINNWNEDRKKRLVEIEILEGIYTDIHQDTIDMNFNIRAYERFILRDSILINSLIDKQPVTMEIVNSLYLSGNADWSLVLHQSHFEEAKSNGLSIITNESLRDQISRLYEFDYRHLSEGENSRQYFDHFKLLQEDISKYLSYGSNGMEIKPQDYQMLLNDSQLLFKIRQGWDWKMGLLRRNYYPIRQQALDLADSIQLELNILRKN